MFFSKINIKTLLLCFLPILLFYIFVLFYSLNVGWNDDWHGIEAFFVSWQQQSGFEAKARLLFSQMCDHRILYVRLSTLVSNAFLGEINYRFLMVFGSAHLLVLPFLFRRVLIAANLGLAYLIPVILIFFTIQPIENIFWAITSLQPNVVLIFGLWAFVLLLFTDKPIYFYLAGFFCFVAMFTNGNGMFTFLAALPIIFYKRSKTERWVWLFMTALCFFFYFFQYEKPGIRPDVGQNFTTYPHIIIADFFAFFGSPIDSTILAYNQTLKHSVAIFSGVILVGWLAVLLFTFIYFRFLSKKNATNWFGQAYKKMLLYPHFNLFLLSAFLFVALSSAAFSVSRASQGLEEAFNSRYKSVSLILFAIFYLSFLNFVPNSKRYLTRSIYITFIFSILSYYSAWDDVLNYRNFKASTMANWINNERYYYYALGKDSRYPIDDHAPITAYQVLPIPPLNFAGFVPGIMKYVNDVLFISRKHYKNYIPPAEINQFRETLFDNKNQVSTTIFKEQISIEKRGIVYAIKIENATVPFLNSQKLSGYYATVVGENAKLCFPLAAPANKISQFISTQTYFRAIIESQVVEPDIPIGDFVISVGKLENQTFTVLKQLPIHVQ